MTSRVREKIGRIENPFRADVTCEYAVTALEQAAILLERGDSLALDTLQREHMPHIERRQLESSLRDEHRWFSGLAYICLLEIAQEITTEQQREGMSFYEIVGKNTFSPNFFQIEAARILYSVERLYGHASKHVGNFTDLITLDCKKVRRGEVVITRRTKGTWRRELEGILGDLVLTQLAHDCELTREFLISAPTIYLDRKGKPKSPAELVEHPQCEARGDSECVYHLRFEPSTLRERIYALLRFPRNLKAYIDSVSEMNIRLQETQRRLNEAYEAARMYEVAQARASTLVGLLAQLAHDANNPLTTAGGAIRQLPTEIGNMLSHVKDRVLPVLGGEKTTELMRELIGGGSPYERIKALVRTMEGRVTEVSDIVHEAHEISQGSLRREDPYKLHETLDSAVREVREYATSQQISFVVEIQRRYLEREVELRGNPAGIKRMFRNILTNACEAMKYNGRIDIRTGLEQGYVLVEISDNGPGMERESIEKAGNEPFTTKDPSLHKMAGIGLLQIYSIANLHNGDVDISSKIGKGTTVKVRLPYEVK